MEPHSTPRAVCSGKALLLLRYCGDCKSMPLEKTFHNFIDFKRQNVIKCMCVSVHARARACVSLCVCESRGFRFTVECSLIILSKAKRN